MYLPHFRLHLLHLLSLLSLTTAIPITILLPNDTIHSPSSIHLPTDPTLPDPAYNTSYPGPVRPAEWTYYHTQYSPDWFHANLDSLTGTACLCSDPPSLSTYNRIASSVRWTYTSHFHRKSYTLSHICGPARAVKGDNHCWSSATGSHYRDGAKPGKESAECVFDEGDEQKLCVDWSREGKRWMSFHGHKREFDREGIYMWVEEEVGQRVEDVCPGVCGDLFGMRMDEEGDHGGSFVKTWFPPKPIPWE